MVAIDTPLFLNQTFSTIIVIVIVIAIAIVIAIVVVIIRTVDAPLFVQLHHGHFMVEQIRQRHHTIPVLRIHRKRP